MTIKETTYSVYAAPKASEMVTLTCYNSGALTVSDNNGRTCKLPPAAAKRLIMAARMKSTEAFLEKLPELISDAELVSIIQGIIEGTTGSERWTLKEKFARLPTIASGFDVSNPDEVAEVFALHPTD